MKVSHILCAWLVCAPLTLQGRAGAAPGGTPPRSDVSFKARHIGGPEPKQTGSRTAGGSNGRDAAAAASPPRGVAASYRRPGQLARDNEARLHSLLSAKSRGRAAKTSTRVGSTRVAAGNMLVRG